MEKEQIAVLLYTILGCIVGYFSTYLTNPLMLFGFVIGIYLITIIPLSRKITVDKLMKWLLSNTFLIYILVWLIVYILLNNTIV